MKKMRNPLVLMVFVACFSASGMDNVSSNAAEEAEVLPLGSYERSSPDVKKLLLYHLLVPEPAALVIGKIGTLRRVCKEWEKLLYDPTLLKPLFRECPYQDDREQYRVTLEYLGIYIGSLMAKKEHTKREREFLQLVQLNSWLFDDLFLGLIVGPDVTLDVLAASDPARLTCVIALYLTCLAVPGEECYRIKNIGLMKVEPLFRNKSCMMRIRHDLERIFAETLTYFEEEVRDEVNTMFFFAIAREVFEANFDSCKKELTYKELAPFLRAYFIKAKLREFLALDGSAFFRLIKERCLVTKRQERFLECALEGDSKALKQCAEDREAQCPVLVDLALLLALKAGKVECVSLLMKLSLTEKRPIEARFLVLLAMLEAVKHCSSELCNALVSIFIDGLSCEYDTNQAILVLFSGIDTEDELMKACNMADAILLAMQIEVRMARSWLKACFNQDLDLLVKKAFRKEIKLYAAMALCSSNRLNLALDVLREDSRFNTIYECLCRVGLLQADSESAHSLTREVKSAFIVFNFEASKEDYLKPEWVCLFIQKLHLEQAGKALVNAALEGDRDKISRLIEQEELSPLDVGLAVLGALSKGYAELASLLIKQLSSYESLESTLEYKEMELAINWALRFSYHYGLEQINKDLFNVIRLAGYAKICTVSAILLTANLSYEGFSLAYKELVRVLNEHENHTHCTFKLPSEEWLQACWNDDASIIKHMAEDIPPVLFFWACKMDKLELLKHLLKDDKLPDIDRKFDFSDCMSWAKKKHPRIAAFLNEFKDKLMKAYNRADAARLDAQIKLREASAAYKKASEVHNV